MYGDKIRILVTGSEGQIGRAFCRVAEKLDNIEIIPVSHRSFDVTDPAAIEAKLADVLPHYLLNGAGFNQEESAVELFARNIMEAGQTFLDSPMESPNIPTWNRVDTAFPNFLDELKNTIELDNKG